MPYAKSTLSANKVDVKFAKLTKFSYIRGLNQPKFIVKMEKPAPSFHQFAPTELWTPPGTKFETPPTLSEVPFVDILATLVRKHHHRPARFYAKQMGIDTTGFNHTVRILTGMPPGQWIAEFVMMDVRWLLLHTQISVDNIASMCNFGKGDSLARPFRKYTGLTPVEYRKKNRVVRTEVITHIEIK